MYYQSKINTPLMYEALDKDTIKFEILPHLSVAKRGYISKNDLLEVILCIPYKFKTGCQWHMLPVSSILMGSVLHYKTVFGHFRQCEWQKVWCMFLERNKPFLGMSSVDLDGSQHHRSSWRGVLWLSRTQEKRAHQRHICH